jgi:hypothetical protein
LAWPLYCVATFILPLLFVLLGQVMSDGAVFSFSYCSRPRCHRGAALHFPPLYLAGLPAVQRRTGSGPQCGIVRADDERVVRGRSVRGRAAPALGEGRPRDSDTTAPTASPPEAQRARLVDAGVC